MKRARRLFQHNRPIVLKNFPPPPNPESLSNIVALHRSGEYHHLSCLAECAILLLGSLPFESLGEFFNTIGAKPSSRPG